MVSRISFQEKERQKNWMGIVLLTNTSLSVGTLLLVLLLLVNDIKLVNKPTPRLVELTDGNTMVVKAIGSLERKPETLKKFTLQIFTLMFTWTGNIELSRGHSISDPGVSIRGISGKKLPTAAWESSFALASDFRQDFLKYLLTLSPSNEIFDERVDVVFVPINIEDPIKLKEGHWQVNLVSNLLIIQDKQTRKIIPFNKKVFLRAVESPNYESIPMNEAHSAIVGVISAIRQPGLEIERIEDLI